MDIAAVIMGQGNTTTGIITNTTTMMGIMMGIGIVGITTTIKGNGPLGVFAPGWPGGRDAAMALH